MNEFAALHADFGQQRTDLRPFSQDYHGAPDPLDPKSGYGEGKKVGELLSVLKSQEGGFEAKIARCFAFIGPHLPLDAHFAAGNFIRDAIAGGPIVVKGDGKSVRSYLYSSDLAIWLWTILFKGKASTAYNVGSEEALSVAELARSIGDIASLAVDITGSNPCGKAGSYVPSVALASQMLGLSQCVMPREAVERSILFGSSIQ